MLHFRGGVDLVCGKPFSEEHTCMLIREWFSKGAAYFSPAAGLIGIISGIASGLFGVGGGIVMVPAMVFFLKLDIKVAVGTSLAVIIPTALMGTYKHLSLGNVDWKIALSLAPTAVLGGYVGAWLTTHISSGNLKRAFGGFLILVGCRLLLGK
jgi:uncharacterized protein